MIGINLNNSKNNLFLWKKKEPALAGSPGNKITINQSFATKVS